MDTRVKPAYDGRMATAMHAAMVLCLPNR